MRLAGAGVGPSQLDVIVERSEAALNLFHPILQYFTVFPAS